MQTAVESKPKPINMSYTSITNMEHVVARARKWGNSVGIIIPKGVADKEGIRPGVDVEALLRGRARGDTVKKTFGLLSGKFKKPIGELMRESDRELYND